MPSAQSDRQAAGRGEPSAGTRLGGFFTAVDRIGRRIPHPFLLFLYLLIALAVATAVLAAVHATAQVPGTAKPEPVRSVLSVTGLTNLLDTLVPNFIGFPPLGVVLAVLLGVGVAERAGFLTTVVSVVLTKVPRGLMPYAVTYIAAQGHVMGDASMVILPPLAALAFRAVGRHPIAGLIGCFASTSVGYASGVLIGALDANLSTITASVVPHGLHISTSVVMNYFFQAAAGLVLPLLTGFILVRWVEPTLPGLPPSTATGAGADAHGAEQAEEGVATVAEPDSTRAGLGLSGPIPPATPQQRRGLVVAVAALAVFLAAVLCCWLIPGGPLQGPGGALVKSPFFDGVVPLVMLSFLVCGIAYGIPAGTIREPADVPRMMGEALKSMLGYIVIAFTAGQFIAMFDWSHLGDYLAVQGADGLRSAHVTGFWALLLMMAFSGLLSLVIFSGASLWTVLAPVLVPIFVGLGFHPGVAQAAYRVGDSVTHPVSPLNPYVYMLELSARRYDPGFTLGGLFARLSLFVVPVAVLWAGLFAVFYFAGIPFGPGTPTHL
ncbi:AbgT family transporter [Streptomyces sp. 8L]|uniref:AbgT family transporter n=1 Tax=Streptomyces sp. 8L TaxID=2877242 RepID=UPI001CD27E4F|nr:AbgT family transporter [Streptomyces sp. 8L]MCA1218142.1 AbgT family transporter [Streptomyces sp. 8L]